MRLREFDEGRRCKRGRSRRRTFRYGFRKLSPSSGAELDSFEESGLNAGAQITRTPTGFDLKGFTCVDGCVATCVISFAEQTDRDWAIANMLARRHKELFKIRLFGAFAAR